MYRGCQGCREPKYTVFLQAFEFWRSSTSVFRRAHMSRFRSEILDVVKTQQNGPACRWNGDMVVSSSSRQPVSLEVEFSESILQKEHRVVCCGWWCADAHGYPSRAHVLCLILVRHSVYKSVFCDLISLRHHVFASVQTWLRVCVCRAFVSVPVLSVEICCCAISGMPPNMANMPSASVAFSMVFGERPTDEVSCQLPSHIASC